MHTFKIIMKPIGNRKRPVVEKIIISSDRDKAIAKARADALIEGFGGYAITDVREVLQ